MTTHMKHFADIREARSALHAAFGILDLEFAGEREGYAIFKARVPGTLRNIGTLFDGPDTMLFVTD